MHVHFISAVAVSIFSNFQEADGWRATIYDDVQHGKTLETLSGGPCQEPKGYNNDKASSINTWGGCVVIYSDYMCKGTNKTMKPGSPHHKDFKLLHFDNVLSSIGPCP
ncbi:uncharacterized protein [Bemisia tabaci]|uniref:uncharacterized protein n=1 Tax=Bemisia tabaci TaxID=7038 RepID=UPI003B2829A5